MASLPINMQNSSHHKSTPEQLNLRRQCARKVFFFVKYYHEALCKLEWWIQIIKQITDIRVKINEIVNPQEAQEIELEISKIVHQVQKKIKTNIGFREYKITNERVFYGRPGKEPVRQPIWWSGYRSIDQINERHEKELERKQAEEKEKKRAELESEWAAMLRRIENKTQSSPRRRR